MPPITFLLCDIEPGHKNASQCKSQTEALHTKTWPGGCRRLRNMLACRWNEGSFIDAKRTSKLSLGNIFCSMECNWSYSDADGGEVEFFDTLNLRRRQTSLFDCMASTILCRISACESNVPLGSIDSRELNGFDDKPPARKSSPSVLFDSCLWYLPLRFDQPQVVLKPIFDRSIVTSLALSFRRFNKVLHFKFGVSNSQCWRAHNLIYHQSKNTTHSYTIFPSHDDV